MPNLVDEYIGDSAVGGYGPGPGGDLHTIVQTKQELDVDYALEPGYNGLTVGPVLTQPGVDLTIPLGSTLLTLGDNVGGGGGGGGGGGSFPDVENYFIVSDIATPVPGKVFTTIAAAMIHVNTLTLSPTNKAVIDVYSKEDSSNFTIPLYVSVVAARNGSRLTGIVTTSGVLTFDPDLINYYKYPTLRGFDILGTIDLSNSVSLEGSLLIDDCNINYNGVGVITSSTYQGILVINRSTLYRMTYANSLACVITRSIVGGVHNYVSTTSGSKEVYMSYCEFDQKPIIPTTPSDFAVDATSGSMELIIRSGRFFESQNALSSGPNGSIVTIACLGADAEFFDTTGFSGIYQNIGNVYIPNNTEATATKIDSALDELYNTKLKKIIDWVAFTNYITDAIVLYENVLYRCVANHTSAAVFENDVALYWQQIRNIRVKDISANTTIDWNDDVVVVDATAGDVTITPPTVFPVHASTKEKHSFYIIRKDSSTNKVIISSTTHPINGQIGSPASNQYLPFQYQSCKLLFNEDQWYVISSGVISGEYVPTITPGTNVTNVTLISAIYVATTEKANSNGIMVTVNLVLDVESTAAATLSDFVISAIRALPANVSGFGSIKSTSDVGPVYAEFQAVDQIKVSYVALSASPGVDRINLLYNCVVQ